MNRDIKIGSIIDYFNLATGDNVKLEIVKANGIMCDGCYFNGIERHCPNDYACGQFARIDKTAIIFKLIKGVEKWEEKKQ